VRVSRECAMTPAVVAHSRIAHHCSRPRHGVIVRGRRTRNGRGRLRHGRPGGTFDLAPQIARAGGRFGKHARGVLQLCARHIVSPQNHPAARVLHGYVERAVGLHAPQIPERVDERRVGNAQAWRTPAATANHECTDEGDTQRQTGAYHAARLDARRAKVNFMPCGRIVDKKRLSRQHTASGWEPTLPFRHSI
jgi:hypothetical protein